MSAGFHAIKATPYWQRYGLGNIPVQQNKKIEYILLASYSSKSLRLNGHFEHFRMVLHVTRRLLLQLFASVLSSHSYSILLQCFDAYAGN